MKETTKRGKPPHPDSPAPWSAGLIDPIDYLILAELPPQGGKLGYHPLGVHARTVAKAIDAPGTTVAGRMKTLHQLELVASVRVMPVARGLAWQITPAGQKALRAWQKQKKHPTEGDSA